MTQSKKTAPSFIEGWERIPGASNYEINASGEARNFQSKKLISSKPDSEGCVQIYGDEKKLQKFNLKEIALKLFPGKKLMDLSINEIISEITPESLKEAIDNIPIEKNVIIPKSKKPALKKDRPKKQQTPKKAAKQPDTKPKAHAKAKIENVSKLNSANIDLKKLKEKKSEIDEIINADIFGYEKIYKLHKIGFSNPEISKITGKRKEVVERDIWLYNSGKKKQI